MCGDTECPSCGTAQGTRTPRADVGGAPVAAKLPALICCKCGAESRELICEGCWHEHGECCQPMPVPGDLLIARGVNGRAMGELHQVTRIMPSTIWTRGLTSGTAYCGIEDFVSREIFVQTFGRDDNAKNR